MAVMFSKHGGQNDEAWKVIDTELSMVIQDTDTEKNKDDELVKSLYNVKTSNKFGEKQGTDMNWHCVFTIRRNRRL